MGSTIEQSNGNGGRFADAIQRRWKKQLEEAENVKYTEEIQEDLAEEALQEDEADSPQETRCSRCRESGRHLFHSKHVLRLNVALCIIDCIMVMVELILDNTAVRHGIEEKYGRYGEKCIEQNVTENLQHAPGRHRRSSGSSGTGKEYGAHSPYAKISHYCHYVSVAILILLTIELLVKVFCFGKRFFRSTLEVFDGFVVIGSLVADLILLDGISSHPPLIRSSTVNLVLPWRIIRVVNSLIIATRDHEHFKLLLVYKAKRHVEDDLYITSKKLRLCEERNMKFLKIFRGAGLSMDELKGTGVNGAVLDTKAQSPVENRGPTIPDDDLTPHKDCTTPMNVTRL